MPANQRSLLALDALNFFNAGIQTGLGPFMAVYYASERHWNPAEVGFLLGAQSLAGVLTQWAIGDVVDRTPHKRAASILAALVVPPDVRASPWHRAFSCNWRHRSPSGSR